MTHVTCTIDVFCCCTILLVQVLPGEQSVTEAVMVSISLYNLLSFENQLKEGKWTEQLLTLSGLQDTKYPLSLYQGRESSL